MDIDVWITTLQGKVLYHRCAPSHGKLSFLTPLAEHTGPHYDDYDDLELNDFRQDEDTFRICIEHQQNPSMAHVAGASRVITLRMKDVDTTVIRHNRAASASDTDRLQRSMRSMHNQLAAMVGDLTQLEHRERTLTKCVAQTAWRVSCLAALSLLVIFATSALQMSYYKTYLRHKKVC